MKSRRPQQSPQTAADAPKQSASPRVQQPHGNQAGAEDIASAGIDQEATPFLDAAAAEKGDVHQVGVGSFHGEAASGHEKHVQNPAELLALSKEFDDLEEDLLQLYGDAIEDSNVYHEAMNDIASELRAHFGNHTPNAVYGYGYQRFSRGDARRALSEGLMLNPTLLRQRPSDLEGYQEVMDEATNLIEGAHGLVRAAAEEYKDMLDQVEGWVRQAERSVEAQETRNAVRQGLWDIFLTSGSALVTILVPPVGGPLLAGRLGLTSHRAIQNTRRVLSVTTTFAAGVGTNLLQQGVVEGEEELSLGEALFAGCKSVAISFAAGVLVRHLGGQNLDTLTSAIAGNIVGEGISRGGEAAFEAAKTVPDLPGAREIIEETVEMYEGYIDEYDIEPAEAQRLAQLQIPSWLACDTDLLEEMCAHMRRSLSDAQRRELIDQALATQDDPFEHSDVPQREAIATHVASALMLHFGYPGPHGALEEALLEQRWPGTTRGGLLALAMEVSGNKDASDFKEAFSREAEDENDGDYYTYQLGRFLGGILHEEVLPAVFWWYANDSDLRWDFLAYLVHTRGQERFDMVRVKQMTSTGFFSAVLAVNNEFGLFNEDVPGKFLSDYPDFWDRYADALCDVIPSYEGHDHEMDGIPGGYRAPPR